MGALEFAWSLGNEGYISLKWFSGRSYNPRPEVSCMWRATWGYTQGR